MNITKITLTAHQISGTAEGTGLVLSITPGYEFQNGKKTDIISHMKYETVFTNNGYEKMTIKVLDMSFYLLSHKAIEHKFIVAMLIAMRYGMKCILLLYSVRKIFMAVWLVLKCRKKIR